jgi:hypothetical protein
MHVTLGSNGNGSSRLRPLMVPYSRMVGACQQIRESPDATAVGHSRFSRALGRYICTCRS